MTWNDLDDVEFATLEHVDWFNHDRIEPSPGFTTPAAFEITSHHQNLPALHGEDSNN